jgi:hypothetical protein
LSRWERFSGFLLCTAGAAVCFAVAFLIGLPLLALKPRKFAVSPALPIGLKLLREFMLTHRLLCRSRSRSAV